MLQAAVEWLNEKDVVRLLLRAHLHQRQYMEQVRPLAGLLAYPAGDRHVKLNQHAAIAGNSMYRMA